LTQPALSGSAATAPEPKPATVLLAEDEILTRLWMADTLRLAGYTVLEAATAEEAKQLLTAFGEVSLIFSDIQMPGKMNGAELARFVRATYPGMPVILTSGAVAPPVDNDCSMAFVPKPYAPEDVLQRIEELLK
jgi:CheY-like chemotaxis protein